MKRHVIQTCDSADDIADAIAIRDALAIVGINSEVKPLHLQRAARVAADIIGEYPDGQREQARDKLIEWLDEALDAARAKRINDADDRLDARYNHLGFVSEETNEWLPSTAAELVVLMKQGRVKSAERAVVAWLFEQVGRAPGDPEDGDSAAITRRLAVLLRDAGAEAFVDLDEVVRAAIARRAYIECN
jgi:hypothetical protein